MAIELNPGLKAVWAKMGITAGVFDFLAASPMAIEKFNRWADKIKGWSGVEFKDWLVGDEINQSIQRFLVLTSGGGASAGYVSINFGLTEARSIIIGRDRLVRLTSKDDFERVFGEKTVADTLIHEIDHTEDPRVIPERYLTPIDYAIARSLGEGDSLAAEFIFSRELVAAGKIQMQQLLDGTREFASLLSNLVDPKVRQSYTNELNKLYDDLSAAGRSREEIKDALKARLADLNREWAVPSTELNSTYFKTDVRDYLAGRLGIEQKDGSWSYLGTLPNDAVKVDEFGNWSVEWELPIGFGGVHPKWSIISGKDQKTGDPYFRAIYSEGFDDSTGNLYWIVKDGDGKSEGSWGGPKSTGTIERFFKWVSGGSAPADGSVVYSFGFDLSGRQIITGIRSRFGQDINRPELDRTIASMGIPVSAVGTLNIEQSENGVWLISAGGDGKSAFSGHIIIGDDGSSVAAWRTSEGANSLAIDANGKIFQRSLEVEDSAYRRTITYFDERGQLLRRLVRQDALDGSHSETTYEIDGTGHKVDFDASGNVRSEETITTGSQAVAVAVGQLASFLGLVQAIQSGKPLPFIVSGVNVAAAVTGNSTLSGVSSGLGSLTSLYNLNRALQQGDTLAAVTAGANALSLGLSAYTNLFSSTAGSTVVGQAIGSLSTPISSSLPGGTPLAYLNLVNDIAHGNAVGMVADIAAIAFPPAAPFIMVAQIIYSLAQGEPAPWGQAKFVFGEDGKVALQVLGGDGGDTMVRNQAQALLDGLNQYLATAQAAGLDLGLIPQRISGIGYKDGAWTLNRIDEVTGADATIRYLDGRVLDVAVGSPEYFRTIGEQFLYDVVAREAVASKWEVDTAKLQTANADPMAGLTELQRAQKIGKQAQALPTGATDQTFRPIVLDLNGDGIQTITRENSGVAFDVDDSGFLKHTAWAGATEGMLVLDRNSNGKADGGTELFSNSKVDLSMRGLAGMSWLDANQDGRIGMDDPVFAQLRVWVDANSDGVVQSGEARSLTDLGITSLNYRLGTFVREGQTLQMGSPDLTADTAGTAAHIVTGGILVQSSNGQTSLIVTKVNDLGTMPGGGNPGGGDPENPGGGDPGGGTPTISMGVDGISGPDVQEDRDLQILPHDLLLNDTINGETGDQLTLTDVTGAKHGTVSLVNGIIHFTPEHDYFGAEAGFTYTAKNSAGVAGQANVIIDLAPVNDAPVAGSQGNFLRDLYGFGGSDEGDLFQGIAYPRFHPGLWRTSQNDPSGGYGWHDTPIVTGYPDPFNGKISVTDVDDTSFTFRILSDAQCGHATINNEGVWHFELSNPQGISDAFQVEITDSHGGKTIKTVSVDVPGVILDVNGPVVLDLDGNGASLIPLAASQAFYDALGDGLRHRTGWVGAGDGLLAYDANGDGEIAGQKELSFKGYKPGAQTDLEGLSAFDTDLDGRLTAGDIGWSQFKVWQDLNGDGISQTGELFTLDEAGISSISLQSDKQFSTQDGNSIHGKSTLAFADGRQTSAYDVAFSVSDEVKIVNADGTSQIIDRPPTSSDAEVVGTDVADTLIGHVGNDHLKGFAGDDFIFDDQGNDVVEAGAGHDTVMTGVGDDIVMAGTDNDVVMAGAGNDLVFGEDGDDALLGEDGNDIIFGGAGNDLVSGGLGNDVLSGDDGDDVITGEQGDDALFGGKGNDQLIGNEGNDRLQGDVGDDLLDGGAGTDTLIGGSGNDRYVVDSPQDTILELAGEGWDQVDSYAQTYALSDNVEELTLKGAALRGIGNALDNVLTGNALDNTLDGGAGNDTLDGGLGADTLIGGLGDDVYVVDNANDQVVELNGGGIDTVRSSADFTLSENVENLVLTGYAPISGNGNDLDNHIVGNAAANRLDGGAGADILEGGLGDDTYVVDEAGDQIIERTGEGVDTVEAAFDYVLGDTLENLTLIGGATRGEGNAQNNILRANDSGNALYGAAGNDQLFGGKGADTLEGGAGSDRMDGGAGDDTYIADDAGDVVVEAAGASIQIQTIAAEIKRGWEWLPDYAVAVDAVIKYIAERPGQSIDWQTVYEDLLQDPAAAASVWVVYLYPQNFEPLRTLDYSNGYVLSGIDTVVSSVDLTLTANVENLTLVGSAALVGVGNELENTLTGNDGDNLLDGGAGADLMIGGAGNDVYIVDSADDVVIEDDATAHPWDRALLLAGAQIKRLAAGQPWEGQVDELMTSVADRVLTSVAAGGDASPGLGELLDQLQLSPFWFQMVYRILGTNLNAVDLGASSVDGGHDTVRTSVNYVAGVGIEDVTLIATAVSATGNALNNMLTGNVLDNVLSGGSGNDHLIGGAGNDRLFGGSGDDVFDWRVGDGMDSISDESGHDALSFGVDLTAQSFDYATELVDGQPVTTLMLLDAQGHPTGEGVRLNGSAATGFEIEELRFSDGSTRSVKDLLAAIDAGKQPAGEDYNGTSGDDIFYVRDAKGGVINRYHGGSGRDTILGDWGDQKLLLASDMSNLDSIEVIDSLDNFRSNAIVGTDGSDHWDFSGITVKHFVIAPGDGNDEVIGTNGDDVIKGGKGADRLFGGAGNDSFLLVSGDDDIDQFDGGSGTNDIFATWGVSTLRVTSTADNLVNIQRIESLDFAAGAFSIVSTSGDDILDFSGMTLVNVQIDAGTGNDVVVGSASDDRIRGGLGADVLSGGAGDDTFVLTASDTDIDRFDGGTGSNKLYGGWGVHELLVTSNMDNLVNIQRIESEEYYEHGFRVVSTGGDDHLDFSAMSLKNVEIDAGAGDDVVIGSAGNDRIHGGAGVDHLFGGGGDDEYLWGTGDGNDHITDDAGNNTIVFGWDVAASDLSVATTDGAWQLQVHTGGGQPALLTIDRFQNSSMHVYVRLGDATYAMEDLPVGNLITPWDAASSASAMTASAGWSSMESQDAQAQDPDRVNNGLIGAAVQRRVAML